MKTDVEVVLEARDNVIGNWYQGNFTDGEGNRCLLGHVAEAVGNYRFSSDSKDNIVFTDWKKECQYARIQRVAFNKLNNTSIGDWNDAPDRTEWEVYAFLDDVARELKEDTNS